jgi:hypothetical protein
MDPFNQITTNSKFWNRNVLNTETVESLSNLVKANLSNYDTSGIALGRVGASTPFNIGALISPNHVLASTHVSTPTSTSYVFRNVSGEIIVCRVDPNKPRVVIKTCDNKNTDMSIIRLLDPATGCIPLKVVNVKPVSGPGFPGSSSPWNYVGATYMQNAILLDGDGDLVRLFFQMNYYPCLPGQSQLEVATWYSYGSNQPAPNKSGSPILIGAKGELMVFAAVHRVNAEHHLCQSEAATLNIPAIAAVLAADNKVLRVGTIQ